MNEITITAQTIEAAVQEALDALEVERNQTNVEIIEPGKKDF
ncbi:Jag N-terminal domain-containing protein [Priestia megaterium]